MSLNIEKLLRRVSKGDGAIVAQCPACAQKGGDQTGNHLIVYPNGKYGCVADSTPTHKRLIHALAAGEGASEAPRQVILQAFQAPIVKVLHKVKRLTMAELGLKAKDTPVLKG